MKFQNIIFDFDGTLVDSAPAILVAFSRVFEQFDLEPAIPLDASLIGPPLDDILIKLSGSAEPEVVGQLATAFKIVYDTTTCLETLAFDGVDAMLKKLKSAGLRLFVATNKRLLPTEKIISHIGWDKGIFEAIYALDSFRPVKPNKSLLIAQLMNDFGLLTTDTVYVGNTRTFTLFLTFQSPKAMLSPIPPHEEHSHDPSALFPDFPVGYTVVSRGVPLCSACLFVWP
jgi:phosphoglycolate phosphatase